MSKTVRSLVKIAVATVACLALSIAYLWERDLSSAALLDRYRILSDAFTLPGLLCMFSGAFFWLSKQGALDAVSWIITYAIKSLIPNGRTTRETYGDYVARRREKRTEGFGFLFLVGAIFMAVAFVFLALFHSVR